MLKITGLNQSYAQSHTLWDVNMEISEGSCISLIGRNGVGKTTLLNCVMGLLPVDSGTMTFDGVDLLAEPAERRASLRIGYVPQGRMIFPLLTVEENLRIGLPARRDPQKVIPSHIFDLFPALAAIGLEKLQVRDAVLVRDIRDPLPVGRPARVERVVLVEGELVRLAAGNGLNVQIRVLVAGTAGG